MFSSDLKEHGNLIVHVIMKCDMLVHLFWKKSVSLLLYGTQGIDSLCQFAGVCMCIMLHFFSLSVYCIVSCGKYFFKKGQDSFSFVWNFKMVTFFFQIWFQILTYLVSSSWSWFGSISFVFLLLRDGCLQMLYYFCDRKLVESINMCSIFFTFITMLQARIISFLQNLQYIL